MALLKRFPHINLDPAAANAALAAKQIDASWGLMPILALKQQKIVEVPLSMGRDRMVLEQFNQVWWVVVNLLSNILKLSKH